MFPVKHLMVPLSTLGLSAPVSRVKAAFVVWKDEPTRRLERCRWEKSIVSTTQAIIWNVLKKERKKENISVRTTRCEAYQPWKTQVQFIFISIMNKPEIRIDNRHINWEGNPPPPPNYSQWLPTTWKSHIPLFKEETMPEDDNLHKEIYRWSTNNLGNKIYRGYAEKSNV